jgi:hypothetical protein
MTPPCPRCGDTKTDPVRHGLMYKLVWAFGYRLHECARCRRPRFIPRHDGKSPYSSQLGKEPVSAPPFVEERVALRTAEENPESKVTKQVTAADSSERGLRRCPDCGSTKYHRTKRTTLEHLLLRPRMARCEKCGLRFPYPGRPEKFPDLLKVREPAETVPRPVEERRAPEMAEESSQPKLTQQVTVVDYSNHGLHRCPVCGSTEYRRSRRTPLERILLRPRMARCRNCRKRFPYPKT